MSTDAERLALDNGWSLSAPCALNRLLHHLIHCEHIIAIHALPWYSIRTSTLGQIRNSKLLACRCRIGIPVVLNQHYQGLLLYGGQINCFVECACAGCS